MESKNDEPGTNFFAEVLKKYEDILVILAPPRTSSTAFARVFWEHPSTGFYCHEPFDLIFHRHLQLIDVKNALLQALDLRELYDRNSGTRLILKEMSFQVGENFHLLAKLTVKPILFIIRNPKQCILSRMKKRQAGGQTPVFPLQESGWEDLAWQIAFCKKQGIPYLLVDSADFRNHPEIVFEKIFDRVGLAFSHDFLTWKPFKNVKIGQIWEEQSHWYRRVLQSRGLQPADEPVPDMDVFPETGGFREHVKKCCGIYADLREDEFMIRLP